MSSISGLLDICSMGVVGSCDPIEDQDHTTPYLWFEITVAIVTVVSGGVLIKTLVYTRKHHWDLPLLIGFAEVIMKGSRNSNWLSECSERGHTRVMKIET